MYAQDRGHLVLVLPSIREEWRCQDLRAEDGVEDATEAQDSRRDDVQDADNEEWVAINDLT